MFKIPAKIEYVLETLTQNGHDAFIVGGCIRDMLLGKAPGDFDIATSAKPDEVQTLFEKTVPTGIKHGTVTVIVENCAIEVTTFRCDGNYTDNRHPENIEFVSNIKDDLARRDFTVNALAYNHSTGIVDFYNGEADLENRVLRAVGEPGKRFEEDALRILRLFRFASVLDFEIEKRTLDAALEKAYLLENISRERILPELYKTVTGKNCEALTELIRLGSLKFLNINNIPDFENIKKLYNNCQLAFFVFLYSSSQDVIDTLTCLKVSNKTKKYSELLLKIINNPIPETKAEIKRILCEVPADIFADFLTFKKICDNCHTDFAKKMLEKILKYNEPYLISHLKINGDYLKAKGYNGSQIGKILNQLQQIVIDCPKVNTTENLISEISKISP